MIGASTLSSWKEISSISGILAPRSKYDASENFKNSKITGNLSEELALIPNISTPAYFVTDDAVAPAGAMEVYCDLMDDWADRILFGETLEGAFPIAAAPTVEHANMLKTRLKYIRNELVPELARHFG